MSTLPISVPVTDTHLPYKGRVAMFTLIAAESAIFSIFVVAYIYYIGQSLSGPTPREVLDLPIFNTIFLLSSSLTIMLAERALVRRAMGNFNLFWGLTILLGAIFLIGTGREWYKLITVDHLTISTNLFGTTYYSLVGLHALHVIVGLILLTAVLVFSLMKALRPEDAKRIEVLALYWHFVDCVWIVVFTVVYVIGR
jgi:cytochrome c oxidase subunit 3/cytochrome o ubiquinol oxidase subunit 3